MSMEITWHPSKIGREDRERLLGQRGFLVWFTGLSGSGKSTIAQRLSERLSEGKNLCYVLDGDNIRHGLNSDLGFTEQDRRENIRRVGEVAKLFVDAGVITLAAFISPYRKDRDRIRNELKNEFIEVYAKCDISECEKRDAKGLYEKARKGEIEDFTGISAPYEEPLNPELIIDTGTLNIEESVDEIMDYLRNNKFI
jgi:adenylylsulfate kinase